MPRPIKTRYMQYVHAKRRAQERYDLWIDEKQYFDFIEMIQKKKPEAAYLGRESNTRTHWLLEDKYIVVYDSTRSSITTFLPPDAIWGYLPVGSFDSKKFKLVDY